MAKKAQSSLQGSDGFTITPSNTGDITGDAANINGYTFIYIHNYGTSGNVQVTLVDQDIASFVQVFVPQGGTLPVQVKKVWATALGAGVTLTAIVGRGGSY